MKKIKECFTEENICFGWDTKGKNIIIYAFEPLRIVAASDVAALVKKPGRGQRRVFALPIEKICFSG